MNNLHAPPSATPLELLGQQWAREAQEQRELAKAQQKIERAAAAEQAKIAKDKIRAKLAAEPEEVLIPVPVPPPPEPPKPKPKEYHYGLTPERRRFLAKSRHDYPQLARELHVWATVYAAPYTTITKLAAACADDSELSVRTWRRVAGDMLTRGQIHLGPRGYEDAGSLDVTTRPQKSDDATRRLLDRLGDDTGPRDPGHRAKRVRHVLRFGRRNGVFYCSARRLAAACAKNGSGKAEGYRDVIDRMLATAELTRDHTGAICLADH